jgi:hypothetical protein
MFREEAEKLDAVHPGHSEVEHDHRRCNRFETFAEGAVVARHDRVEPAQMRGLGNELGEGGLVVDQQQPGPIGHAQNLSPA